MYLNREPLHNFNIYYILNIFIIIITRWWLTSTSNNSRARKHLKRFAIDPFYNLFITIRCARIDPRWICHGSRQVAHTNFFTNVYFLYGIKILYFRDDRSLNSHKYNPMILTIRHSSITLYLLHQPFSWEPLSNNVWEGARCTIDHPQIRLRSKVNSHLTLLYFFPTLIYSPSLNSLSYLSYTRYITKWL